MTESTLTLGADADPADDARGTRRVLLLAAGVVGSLALAAGGFLLLGGDDDELLDSPPPLAVTQPKTAATPVAKPAALPRPFDADLGRNPFKALYVAPAAAAGPGAAGVGDPTLAGPRPDAPAVPAGTGAGTPVVPVGGPALPVGGPVLPVGGPVLPDGGPPAPVAGPVLAPLPPVGGPVVPAVPTDREHALVLRTVRGDGEARRAAFTIDGRSVTVKVGGTFGPTKEIRLISLQEGPGAGQWTAVLQVGDGGPFDAVTGQAVSVR